MQLAITVPTMNIKTVLKQFLFVKSSQAKAKLIDYFMVSHSCGAITVGLVHSIVLRCIKDKPPGLPLFHCKEAIQDQQFILVIVLRQRFSFRLTTNSFSCLSTYHFLTLFFPMLYLKMWGSDFSKRLNWSGMNTRPQMLSQMIFAMRHTSYTLPSVLNFISWLPSFVHLQHLFYSSSSTGC
jgi:hypothetical protein